MPVCSFEIKFSMFTYFKTFTFSPMRGNERTLRISFVCRLIEEISESRVLHNQI